MGVSDWLQSKLSWLVNDSDIVEAANNCYSAICFNSDKSGTLACDYKLDDVAHVIWAYINYFVTNPDQSAKYYYDEAIDRKDAYRKALVATIAKTISKDAEFANQVLSYLYWGIKRKKVVIGILRPREVAKFKDPDYWYSGLLGGLFKISVEMTRFAEKVLKEIGYVVSSAGEGITGVLRMTASAISYLPYIIGGCVVVGGVIIYKNRDTVKAVTVKKLGNSKALSDGYKKRRIKS